MPSSWAEWHLKTFQQSKAKMSNSRLYLNFSMGIKGIQVITHSFHLLLTNSYSCSRVSHLPTYPATNLQSPILNLHSALSPLSFNSLLCRSNVSHWFYMFTPFSLLEQSRVLGEDPECKDLFNLEDRKNIGGNNEYWCE